MATLQLPKNREEAFEKYLKEKWELVFPFDDIIETSFLDYLQGFPGNNYDYNNAKKGRLA